MYKSHDFELEVENPYDQAGTFKVTIIESNSRNGVIRNPYNSKQNGDDEQTSEFKLPTIDKKHGMRVKQASKFSFESQRLEKLKEAEKKDGQFISSTFEIHHYHLIFSHCDFNNFRRIKRPQTFSKRFCMPYTDHSLGS